MAKQGYGQLKRKLNWLERRLEEKRRKRKGEEERKIFGCGLFIA